MTHAPTPMSGGSDRPRAGLSIRYSLPLLIAALAAAVLTVYAAAAYHQVRESAVEAAGERLTNVTEQLSGMLTDAATGFIPEVTTRAADPAVIAFLRNTGTGDSAAAVAALGGGALTYGRELRDLAMRRVLATRDDMPGGVTADPALSATIARSSAGAVGSIRMAGDSLVIPVAAAVTAGGRPVGYLVSWRRISGSGQSTIEQLVGSDAHMYIANRTGDLWTDLIQPVEAPPLDLTQVRGPVEYERPGSGAWLAAMTAVEGTPWLVLVEMPRRAVIAHARDVLRTFVLLGILALLLGAAVTWALARRFTEPIMDLACTAKAFSAGDYTRRSAVSRRDEIGTLSSVFNTMADNVAGAHGILEQKVTQLAELESRHRRVGERLGQMLAASPVVIYEMETTAQGPVFTWISENVERLVGASAGEVMEPGWWSAHLHPDDTAPALQPAEDFGNGEEATRELRLRHRDGRYRWIRDRQRLVNGGGRVVGAWSDVTELRSLEEQFRQAQKLEAVGRLAGGIAHDFNNIVTVILGETEMALSTLPPGSPVRDSLAEVRTASERAALLTRQLLTFSRKQLTETSVLDLNDVVRGVHGMLGRLIGEDVDLQFRLGEGLARVTADRAQIEQVLLNLVINARDAMPDGGTIIIETRNVTLDADYERSHPGSDTGEYVALVVSDNGTGMSPEARAHLFEPFFTTKGPGKGTGLGLATCYGIARQFGGHLRVYSEVGAGTTVRLYLPRTTEAEPETDAGDARHALSRGSETVLLVEDEPQVRAIIARMLEAQGYRVIGAANGTEALELIEKDEDHAIDLLLTDLVMPRMGGRELAERVRVLRPQLRVLFTSGYTEDVIMQNRLLDRDIVLLHKPFTRLELATRVREVLDAPVAPA